MTRLALVLLSLLSTGCIDFEGIGLDRCANTPGLCGDGGTVAFCGACTRNEDCSGALGLCINEPGGGRFCGRDCTSLTCGANEVCINVTAGTVVGRGCVARTLCDGGVR